MKKVVCAIVGLMCMAVTFVACFDEKDFEFDKITISDLEPTLYLPLVNDTVRLDASGDYNVLYDDVTGEGYLYFDVDSDDIFPSNMSDFFAVPDATLTVPEISFPYNSVIGGTFPYPLPPSSSALTYSFDFGTQAGSDSEIDSVVFKGGTLEFNLGASSSLNSISGSTYTVTIDALTKNGAPFSQVKHFNEQITEPLQDYKLSFTAGNAFDIDLDITIASAPSDGTHTFSPEVSFSGVDMKKVHGYFGHRVLDPPSTFSMPVTAFDKFKEGSSTLTLERADLYFTVTNGMGIPIRLRIDEVKSITADGQVKTETKVDSVNIPALREAPQEIGGEALGTVLSNMPSEVRFQFSTIINPDGPTGEKNSLTDASSITVSNIEARVPLDFSVKGMVLKDTLDFNASNVTFKDMGLLLNVQNNMPVKVSLQAYLIDKSNHDVSSTPLFAEAVSIPAASVDADGKVTAPRLHVQNIETNVEGLEQAKKIRVEITVDTEETSNVRITKDNYVYLKIGAKAKVNIDNLD